MTKFIPLCTILVFSCVPVVNAQLSWTGTASSDIFDIANWDATSSTVSGALAANTSINDNVVVSGDFANNPITPQLDGQVRFQIGDGFGLTLDGATWGLEAGANDGFGGEGGGTAATTVNVTNGSSFTSFFITNNVSMSIDGTSSVTLGGGGNPVNNGTGGATTIDMMPGATLTFTSETPQQFIDEHLAQVLVGGQPASDGVNIEIVADGAAGSRVTAMVPEPSAGFLVAMFLPFLLACARRRRDG